MPKEPFEFHQSSYKQVLISCTQSYFKKLKYRLAEETMFFPLVITNLVVKHVSVFSRFM